MNQQHFIGLLLVVSQTIAMTLFGLTAFSRATKIFALQRNREAIFAIANYMSRKWDRFCNGPVWIGELSGRGERMSARVIMLMLCGLSAVFFVYGLGYAIVTLTAVGHDPSALLLSAPMLLAMWFGGLLGRAAKRLRMEIAAAII
jgi:energy-converting hydrogenase Eha subunit B